MSLGSKQRGCTWGYLGGAISRTNRGTEGARRCRGAWRSLAYLRGRRLVCEGGNVTVLGHVPPRALVELVPWRLPTPPRTRTFVDL
jgi:hypothetical protein